MAIKWTTVEVKSEGKKVGEARVVDSADLVDLLESPDIGEAEVVRLAIAQYRAEASNKVRAAATADKRRIADLQGTLYRRMGDLHARGKAEEAAALFTAIRAAGEDVEELVKLEKASKR